MSVHMQLQSTLDEISHSLSHEDLWLKLISYMRFCEIQAFVYHHLPPPGAFDYYENIIVKKQIQKSDDDQVEFVALLFDTVLRKGARAMQDDIYWSYDAETAKNLIADNENSCTLKITENIKGQTIPVHGPNGRNGCFSLVYNEADPRKSEQNIRLLKWVCQNVHQFFCKLYLLNSDTLPRLTARETEILSWVARGKSNNVIAQILGISPHTVNTYMRRLFLKLGTSDRTSVSLIGISNGLIDI